MRLRPRPERPEMLANVRRSEAEAELESLAALSDSESEGDPHRPRCEDVIEWRMDEDVDVLEERRALRDDVGGVLRGAGLPPSSSRKRRAFWVALPYASSAVAWM